MGHDVFISYCEQDKATADGVCAGLENAGIRCWIASRDIPPGRDWADEIVLAINSSKAFVLLFSGHCNGSVYVENEIHWAVDKKIPVIVFRLDDSEPRDALKFRISRFNWLTASRTPLKDYYSALTSAVLKFLPDDCEHVSDKNNAWLPHPGMTHETTASSSEERPFDDMGRGYLWLGITFFLVFVLPAMSRWDHDINVIGLILGTLTQVLACRHFALGKGYETKWSALGLILVLGPLILWLMADLTSGASRNSGADQNS